jgi:acyl dehydratase
VALPLDKLGTTYPPRSAGLSATIAHGLCTMAMWSRSVVTTVADDDPTGRGAVVMTNAVTNGLAEVV